MSDSIQYLLLGDNHFSNHLQLHDKLKALLTKGHVLVHNRLSCELPNINVTNASNASLIALGNLFSSGGSLPNWLSPDERGASLLFVSSPEEYLETIAYGAVLALILVILLACCGTLLHLNALANAVAITSLGIWSFWKTFRCSAGCDWAFVFDTSVL